MENQFKGFFNFIREQGVVGLAVGFMLGGAVSKLVSALIADIIKPLISGVIGKTNALKTASVKIGSSEILWGDFLSVSIDFLVITLVVYYGVKIIGIERLDKKKE